MTDTGHTDGWSDVVASEGDGVEGRQGWRALSREDALSFARLTVECAVQPLLALVAELPALLHFEIRERRARRRAHRCATPDRG